MSKVEIGINQIKELLPHRAPFLFVDRICELEEGKRILAELELRPDEPHFSGHFPSEPIMPGVLITEALAQTAGLLLALTELKSKSDNPNPMFYLARADMKWTRAARPGQILKLEARLLKTLEYLQAFRVKAFTETNDIASGGLTLAQVKRDASQ